jgi:F-type H+-transporting ATPase subunit epsilon
MAKILLEVITPDRVVVREEVDSVTAIGAEGEFTVLPGHAAYLPLLEIGEGHYIRDGHTEYMAIAGGIAEVSKDRMTILAEAAELGREIDAERARKARERALERLRKREDVDIARAGAAQARAIARIKIAEKVR